MAAENRKEAGEQFPESAEAPAPYSTLSRPQRAVQKERKESTHEGPGRRGGPPEGTGYTREVRRVEGRVTV